MVYILYHSHTKRTFLFLVYVYRELHLFIYLFIYLFICLFIYLFIPQYGKEGYVTYLTNS